MKRFLVSAIVLAAIIILPAPIWLYLTHKSSYPIASDKNLLFIGDSRIKYSIDDAALSRCANHSFSGETPFGAYITLRALLSYEESERDAKKN